MIPWPAWKKKKKNGRGKHGGCGGWGRPEVVLEGFPLRAPTAVGSDDPWEC